VELIDAASRLPLDPSCVPDGHLRRAQERHLEWTARELWLRQSRREREGTAARAKALVARAMSDAAARRMGITTIRGEAQRETIRGARAERSVIESLSRRGRSLLVPVGVAAGIGREISDAECDECVILPELRGDGRYVAIPVVGDSMTPAMHDGDLVLVKLGAAAVRDSVVVARHPEDGYVVKRVGARSRDGLELLSLNPAYPPLRIPEDSRLILGTVILRWCAHDDLKRA
jgi:phage repressor protein C with HTH and peptisase S24 domain